MEHGTNHRPPHDHLSLCADLINKIFPAGLDKGSEMCMRNIAAKIGYNVICDLNKGVIEDVDIDKICPCQEVLSKSRVIELILYIRENDVPGYPAAIRKDGFVYLLDGHHRVAAQILSGKKKIKIHITDIDENNNLK